jgi:hypothetical protein
MEDVLLIAGIVAVALLIVALVFVPFMLMGIRRRLDAVLAEQRRITALLHGRPAAPPPADAPPPPAPPRSKPPRDAPLAPDEVDDLGGFKAER